jgi:predicted cupin superfamily sugar epimerase
VSPASGLIDKLALQPHPEGGWYREIYRSPTRVETARGSRSAITTIYYLLERHQLSRWHVVQADELWHFYAGAPLELLEYDPTTRRLTPHVLGHVDTAPAASAGATPPSVVTVSAGAGGAVRPAAAIAAAPAASAISVAVIPARVWQAARSLGEYSLVGCTVGPGFEFADFQFTSDLPSHADHFQGDLAPFAGLL